MTGVPRHRLVRTVVMTFLIVMAAVGAADGQVPTAVDAAACNDEAPAIVKARAASPTTSDAARAKGARDGSPTSGAGDFRLPLVNSSDPQIHGMSAEGAKDAAYQAAYRSCMRRKGF
jgi:hypothetical protein